MWSPDRSRSRPSLAWDTLSKSPDPGKEPADEDAAGGSASQSPRSTWLDEFIGLNASMTILEIAVGAGKYMPLLIRSGAKVIALEPDAELRAEVKAGFGIKILDGSIDCIDLPDGCVDVVFCAQPFRWKASPAALAEMHRVLKPQGTLAVVWNVFDDPGRRPRKRRTPR